MGFFFYAEDIIDNQTEEPKRKFDLIRIVKLYILFINLAKEFYLKFNYNGLLVGKLSIEGVESAAIFPVDRFHPFFSPLETKRSILNDYDWNFTIDTSELNSSSLKAKQIEQVHSIIIGLGYFDTTKEVIDDLINKIK